MKVEQSVQKFPSHLISSAESCVGHAVTSVFFGLDDQGAWELLPFSSGIRSVSVSVTASLRRYSRWLRQVGRVEK